MLFRPWLDHHLYDQNETDNDNIMTIKYTQQIINCLYLQKLIFVTNENDF